MSPLIPEPKKHASTNQAVRLPERRFSELSTRVKFNRPLFILRSYLQERGRSAETVRALSNANLPRSFSQRAIGVVQKEREGLSLDQSHVCVKSPLLSRTTG